MQRLSVLLLVVCVAAASHAAEVRDLSTFANELIDLDGLPLLQPGVTCAQASSYDRASKYDADTGEYVNWSANSDWGQYIRVDEETKEGVMAELDGPGCIFRIWSAHPRGVIRFYLDGDTKPTYEFDFDKLFSGEIEPFRRPFVWQRKVVFGGENPASNCYVPIPFAKSCKVTSVILDENGEPKETPGHYYHIGYKLYPKDWQVKTFNLPITPRQRAALLNVARAWDACGQDPQPAPNAGVQNAMFEIEPGGTVEIFDMTGPATIRQFHAKIESKDPYATRNVVLRAFWDGEKSPSILTPLGDFFGRAVGEKPYASLPLGVTDDMDYCYWRMPFRTHGTLTVENQGPEPITIKARFVYTTGSVPDAAAYFRAKWRREPRSNTFDYAFLRCKGSAGIFVGDLLIIDNFRGGWWGEGDEKLYVDGEKFPSTFGTGSEDYYGDAWGIRWFVNPFHGCPQNEGRKQLCYRWHISDSVPFTSSFTATIENYSAVREDGILNGYASVVYWYQMPGGDDFFPDELPPAAERLPSPRFVVPGAIEAEEILAAATKAAELHDPAVRDVYSGGKAIALGASPLIVIVPIETGDVYSIALFEKPGVAVGEDACIVLHEGEPVAGKLFLAQGEHTFTVQRVPDRAEPVVLDYILVEPCLNYITDWLVLGPFDNTDGTGYDTVYPPETKLDLDAEYDVVGGKAAWQRLEADDKGLVELDPHFEPDNWVIAYAYAEVISPDERDAELLIGSDDGVKAWLNGALVHDNEAVRGWTPDDDRVAIHLSKGTNTLLLKISENAGAWEFSARIVDPDDALRYKLPE